MRIELSLEPREMILESFTFEADGKPATVVSVGPPLP
jgi:hypothetical protein